MCVCVCVCVCHTVIGMALLSHPCARQVLQDFPMHAGFLDGKFAVLKDARKRALHCLCSFLISA